LNKYRQAGGSTPGRGRNRLLVQEVMEEEWNSLQSVENCPQALAQVRLGYVFEGMGLHHKDLIVSSLYLCIQVLSLYSPLCPQALDPDSSAFTIRLCHVDSSLTPDHIPAVSLQHNNL
jgi:hypothetical protein